MQKTHSPEGAGQGDGHPTFDNLKPQPHRMKQQPTHGFRISWLDGGVLALGSLLTFWLHRIAHPLWWLVGMVLGHFFLFCNVFLVWQRWELIWAAIFVINVAAHLVIGGLGGASVLLWQLPVTMLIIGLQIRSPYYHGIFAQHWNTRLSEYLKNNPKTP